MKFIRDIHEQCRAEGRPAISFEFFPPKTDEGERSLFEKTIPALLAIRPDYCSVTYGAGGGTREKTLGIVDRIQREHALTAMMHLTCVNSTREQLGGVLAEARARSIDNILALRGDPPGGSPRNARMFLMPLARACSTTSRSCSFVEFTHVRCIIAVSPCSR